MDRPADGGAVGERWGRVASGSEGMGGWREEWEKEEEIDGRGEWGGDGRDREGLEERRGRDGGRDGEGLKGRMGREW